ncbi:putative extracellular protein [Phytophthora megakarya]|uniref:Putative extracellular protein n=1 Tax=Phytophthora megakarya TaxID=4795 RepID=A0A225WD32_9STRA|nr:putative extracellular protein [Phytophthora megakarya]
MGMACDAEGGAVTGEHEVPSAKTGGACGDQAEEAKSEAPGLNPEETAMILTSLSKGFSGANASGTPESDGEDMGDSDEDEDTAHRQLAIGGVGKVHRVQQINFDGPKGSKLDFTDDAGFSHRFRNESNRVKSLVTKHISIEELRAHFDRPIIDVAKDFGICITLMKKICRRNGIKRWPHRQIRSLSKSIASMEAAMLSAHGSERDKYRDQIVNLKMKRESVIADPNKDNSMRPKVLLPSSVHSDASGQSMRIPSTLKLSPRPDHDVHASSQGYPVTPTVKMEYLAVGTPVPTSSTLTTGPSKGGRWTSEEHAAFLEGIRLYGKDWRRVAQVVMTRSAVQTRTHAQKYLLKFAGRFPFDADGMLKDHHPAPVQTQTQSTPMLSPTTSVASSNTAMTNGSDDSVSNGSWNSEEAQPPSKHGEAMAMILNGSPQVEPVAVPQRNNVGTSLPPLPARTLIKSEQTVAFQPQQGAAASFQYFTQQVAP